ncbi:MAG: cytochrome bc complex cytochrome b subunit [Candidatus Obscuribacterales bacterium]|nr:cytochrome bc complex cytochrome b subunit [Candidatus Obscuribacterales bacterium]
MLHFISSRFPSEKLNFNWLVNEKYVPIHKMTWGYYTGGLVLFFLTIQIITGLLLLLNYQATVSDAFVSVKTIIDNVHGGALIRNMHVWSSSLMIFFTLVHLLTTFSMKAFASPREITWVAGVLLLFVTFAFGFTGYLLPWNQLSVNATKVLLQSLDQAGALLPTFLAEVPQLMKQLLQGGETIGQATLSRFFALHVVILPTLLLVVLGIHLLSVQVHGMSHGVDDSSSKSEKFFPLFLCRDLRLWSFAFFILYTFSLCLPFDSFIAFPLLQPYDPFGATPEGIKPEWYFYFIYYPLELLPFWLVMLLLSFVCLILLLTPWIFSKTSRKLLTALALMAAGYLIAITVFGQSIYSYLRGGQS